MAEAFSDDQRHYIEGFTSGLAITRWRQRLEHGGAPPPAAPAPEDPASHPDAMARTSQARLLATGGRLTAEEQAKRERHPLDRWAELTERARAGRLPSGVDTFVTKYFGLFNVAPAEDAFMCRLRLPNGLLTAHQLEGIAAIAQDCAAGHADITTRANLQLRGIPATLGPEVVMRLQELGILTRGSGADNVRNITGSATAGIDPGEILDTRPFARAIHHAILSTRALYNLPRKFNIAFDGGGSIGTLEETNDIAFSAVRVTDEPGLPDGIGFAIAFGGITGHGDFARATACVCAPEDAVAVAVAAIEVFSEAGDRSDRKRARLKYLLDAWGHERFLAALEERLGRPLPRPDPARVQGPARSDGGRIAHVGVHPQRQPGLAWVGVLPPGGRLQAAQLRGLAAAARRHAADERGQTDVRLTVWQSLIIANVPLSACATLCAELDALGLPTQAGPVRAGMVACTGSRGCRFAAADTKATAADIIDHVEALGIPLDVPINVHVTGCHHSCAQHFIGDIGLIACRILDPLTDEDTPGFDIVIGGGHGVGARIGEAMRSRVPVADIPAVVARLIEGYLAHRAGPDEDFSACARRVGGDALYNRATGGQPT